MRKIIIVLVLSFFVAVPAFAQTASYTRNLTIGSKGSDVSALQSFLISKGFSIPAGATGYFGIQTRTALAGYQSTNGITPAVGFFGPLTRGRLASGPSAPQITTPLQTAPVVEAPRVIKKRMTDVAPVDATAEQIAQQTEKEKTDLRDKRGVGQAKAHIYIDTDGDAPAIAVSMSDFFSQESPTIAVFATDKGVKGKEITGDGAAAQCGGKIAGSELKTCSLLQLFPLPDSKSAAVEITYGTEMKSFEITASNKSGWLDWN